MSPASPSELHSDSSCDLDTASFVDDEVQRLASLTPEIAKLVADMSILNPEVLRVTPAYKVFQTCAEAFHRKNERELHHKSRRSEEITTFWSHSWHGGCWQKVLTLMVFYNSLASILLGTVAAFTMMWLFALGYLPGFARTSQGDMLWSPWSLGTGLVVSLVSFVLWKPKEDVFFDRICISQDSDLKAEAIFSLAGMMKNSKKMLVLWDPSWSDRLWCLFELAAFLKCKGAVTGEVLMIRPTFVGPCSIAAFLTAGASMLALTTFPMASSESGPSTHLIPRVLGVLSICCVVGLSALMAFRGYFRSLQVLDEKLKSTSFEKVQSACCQQNHVNCLGHPILCDREVVKQCVTIWFGSTVAFEELIRSDVSELIATELCRNVFTRKWILQVLAPIVWAFMDFSASYIRSASWDLASQQAMRGLVAWLLVGPMLVELGILLSSRYCSEARCQICGPCSDFFLTLGLQLVINTFDGSMGLIYFLIRKAIPDSHLASTATFAGTMLMIACFINSIFKKALGAPWKSHAHTPDV